MLLDGLQVSHCTVESTLIIMRECLFLFLKWN